MTDIVERLRLLVPSNAFNAMSNAEIARLRAGGCARDQGTTQFCAEAAKLAAENGKLRAALEEVRVLVFGANHSEARYPLARAALEGE